MIAGAGFDGAVERLLRVGSVILVGGGIAMLVAPSMAAALFGLEIGPGGDFMTRRYGASGTIGLGVALWQSQHHTAPSTVLAGLAAWFFVQGGVALVALAGGTVSAFALFAAGVDLALGSGALVLTRKRRSATDRG